ncbi:RNA-binding protein, RNP-1 [Candidatus Koribacter versatilis Ellin345]|uniref:RNA-binding protein, RNP-1 n=1 Tax=Koribacter versatilis (strain Ellin345) TaxID=204669 RepID=Q1IV44_KORVE|nr:RNA-binding protein [Candidatus Koribacter versatilis]ABF39256.1 RNA-binding protein, RNP-1 [Candidatus Koribacter versatilis Ellin345]
MKKIFVGNFAFTATEDDIRQLFTPYGKVDSVSLVTDRDTGRARGFGFVEMPNDTEAAAAIEGLNGRDSGGRALNVNEARPKTERGNSGGGGGRGNFRDKGRKREPRW